MKNNAIIRIILYSAGILVLSAVLLTSLGLWSFSFSGSHWDQTDSTPALSTRVFTAEPTQIRNIDIEWVAGNITIAPSDQVDQIRVEESDVEDKYRMVCKVSGNTLSIQYSNNSIKFPSIGISTDISKELIITVPSDWLCQSVEIDTASANVDIRNMIIGEFDFDGASGECVLTDCDLGTMDLDAASGDIRFSGCLDALDFDGASADCILALTNCPSRIDMDGMSGDLDLTLPSDCGFSVDMNGMSSNFSSDFETTSRNGSHVHGDGSCKIRISAMSGNVIIRKGNDTCHEEHHN